MPSDPQQQVLATLRAKTNEYQGEWTSQRTLLTTLVADGSLSRDAVDKSVTALLEAGRIDVDEESGDFRLADAGLN